MKRADIKRRPLADTTLAGLEPETKEYRELDGNGLYFRVKPDGGKSWQLRYKRPAGNWAWMGLGGYPEVSGALARETRLTSAFRSRHRGGPRVASQVGQARGEPRK